LVVAAQDPDTVIKDKRTFHGKCWRNKVEEIRIALGKPQKLNFARRVMFKYLEPK
jgi:hypothetical protein